MWNLKSKLHFTIKWITLRKAKKSITKSPGLWVNANKDKWGLNVRIKILSCSCMKYYIIKDQWGLPSRIKIFSCSFAFNVDLLRAIRKCVTWVYENFSHLKSAPKVVLKICNIIFTYLYLFSLTSSYLPRRHYLLFQINKNI